MEGINRGGHIFALLLLWYVVLNFLPFTVGGMFLILFSVAFWFLLFISFLVSLFVSRFSSKVRFTINSRFILSALVTFALLVAMMSYILKWMPNFEDPVSEQQARVMAAHWLKNTGSKGSPGYVFMRKGDDAGDIGYYVFDMNTENKGFLIVPADARFTSIYYRNDGRSYLDFYLWYSQGSSFPKFSNTPLLKLKSLVNKILSQKSKEQLAWSEVLKKRNEGAVLQ